MAYNRNYNPDALPRFAEPDQPAGSAPSNTSTPPQSSRYDKPAPAPPAQHHRPSGAGAGGSGSRYDPHASPPPHQTSHRPPPTAQARPPAQSRPPPTPGPEGSGADPTLLPLFRAVDKAGTGQLSEKELSAALVNGDWTSFDSQTVRMMIRMFDADRSGTIGFDEFCGLWSFLASWRTLFDRFDVDRSGNISLPEFTDALVAFRYRLSPPFVELLFRTYDKRGEGVMSFDLFVQAMVRVKKLTDIFKHYDEDRDGYITLSFEDFLSEILKQQAWMRD